MNCFDLPPANNPGAEWRWADKMGEAHPPTAEEAKPTIPSHDKARGGRPVRAVGAKAPMQTAFRAVGGEAPQT